MIDGKSVIRHIVVRGRVQGVGFRAFVEDEATRRGIAGWVRNRRDGAVEALFAGEFGAVEDLVAACRKGPYASRVNNLDMREGTTGELALRQPGVAFSVLPTV